MPTRRRQVAWILVMIVALSFIVWGAGAAIAPDRLAGPGGMGILPAGYEGFTGVSWDELARSTPKTAAYFVVLYRMYGIFNVVFGLMASAITVTAFRRGEAWAWWTLLVANTVALGSAMIYDRTVRAIGPFELTEYLGLAMVWLALLLTVPLHARARPLPMTASAPGPASR